MSKASQGIKLVKWLANQADDVAASAYDLKRYGPKATRVRSLLDFIPTMSADAARVSNDAYTAAWDSRDPAVRSAWIAAYIATSKGSRSGSSDAYRSARNAAYRAAKKAARNAAWSAADNTAFAARNAGGAESISHLIDPNTYRLLTNPLTAGREADIVNMNAPENFMDIIRGLTERNLIMNPQDVRSARKLADLTDYERDPVMEYINTMITGDKTGYRYPGSAYKSLEELIKSARLI